MSYEGVSKPIVATTTGRPSLVRQSVIRHYFLYWPLAFGGAVSYVNKSERVYGNTGNLFLRDF